MRSYRDYNRVNSNDQPQNFALESQFNILRIQMKCNIIKDNFML